MSIGSLGAAVGLGSETSCRFSARSTTQRQPAQPAHRPTNSAVVPVLRRLRPAAQTTRHRYHGKGAAQRILAPDELQQQTSSASRARQARRQRRITTMSASTSIATAGTASIRSRGCISAMDTDGDGTVSRKPRWKLRPEQPGRHHRAGGQPVHCAEQRQHRQPHTDTAAERPAGGRSERRCARPSPPSSPRHAAVGRSGRRRSRPRRWTATAAAAVSQSEFETMSTSLEAAPPTRPMRFTPRSIPAAPDRSARSAFTNAVTACNPQPLKDTDRRSEPAGCVPVERHHGVADRHGERHRLAEGKARLLPRPSTLSPNYRSSELRSTAFDTCWCPAPSAGSVDPNRPSTEPLPSKTPAPYIASSLGIRGYRRRRSISSRPARRVEQCDFIHLKNVGAPAFDMQQLATATDGCCPSPNTPAFFRHQFRRSRPGRLHLRRVGAQCRTAALSCMHQCRATPASASASDAWRHRVTPLVLAPSLSANAAALEPEKAGVGLVQLSIRSHSP